jgi:hypothetical protein
MAAGFSGAAAGGGAVEQAAISHAAAPTGIDFRKALRCIACSFPLVFQRWRD